MSTSKAYLHARLVALGRNDLLAAVEQRTLSYYAAAESCGIIKRRDTGGTGSQNAARRRSFAVERGVGTKPPLPPKPEPEPMPAKSEFSATTRALIAELVEQGRT